jgi:hypothetical protein
MPFLREFPEECGDTASIMMLTQPFQTELMESVGTDKGHCSTTRAEEGLWILHTGGLPHHP